MNFGDDLAGLKALPRLKPGELQTSPFARLRHDANGPSVFESLSGKTYDLSCDEANLLDQCHAGYPADELSPQDKRVARRLAERWLLFDTAAFDWIGRLTFSVLDLEAAGACNAACVFCPREVLRKSCGVGIMSVQTFDLLLERFGDHVTVAAFAGIGEPTLNRNLPLFVRKLSERRIKSMLVTNGSLLTKALIEALIAAGLSSIQVSFNGHANATKPLYEANMLGLRYDSTRANIDLLIRCADGRLPVYISAVETLDNELSLLGFVEYWRSKGANARVVKCHSRGGTIDLSRYVGADRGFVETAMWRCGLFASRSFVTWDGRVLACCHDVRGAAFIGHVRTDSTETIIARKLGLLSRGEGFPLCRNCDEPARNVSLTPDRARMLSNHRGGNSTPAAAL